jgi:hypothetical protein
MKSPAAFFTVAGILLAVSVPLMLFYLRQMIANRTLPVLERQARYYVLAFLVVLVDYAVMVGAFGFPWEPSQAVIGLYGLAGLVNLIGRNERREGKVIMDERDCEIQRKASLGGFASFYLFVWLLWIVFYARAGSEGVVRVRMGQLGFLLMVGMVIVMTVGGLITLVMYRRSSLAEAN